MERQISMDEPYLTVKEVAALLRVSRQSIYIWIDEGRLQAVKIGKNVRVARRDLDSLIRPIVPAQEAR
jgi:excisionase family DNA binding protein